MSSYPPPGPEDPSSAGPSGQPGPYGAGQYPSHDAGPDGAGRYPSQYGRYPGHPDQYPGWYAPNGPFPGSGLVGPDDPLVPHSFSEWVSKVVGVVSRSWQPLLLVQLAAALPGLVLGGVGDGLLSDPNSLAGPNSLSGPNSLPGPSSLSDAAITGLSAGALVFAVIAIVFGLFAQGASVFIAVRDAVGRPARAGEALSFAGGRALPLLGWGLVAVLLLVAGFLVLVIPGLYMAVVFTAALTGVVVIERQGVGRAFALVNRRFWPTAGRLVVVGVAALVYNTIIGWVAGALSGGSPFVSTVLSSVLVLPLALVMVGVAVVTYAELRNHEDPSVGSATLAAQMES